ncbi:unnamed protein product [Calypogeia fissa]
MGLKVVVTGGSGGIGRATALRFSKDGHEVFITGRSEAKLDETVNLAKAQLKTLSTHLQPKMLYHQSEHQSGSGAFFTYPSPLSSLVPTC